MNLTLCYDSYTQEPHVNSSELVKHFKFNECKFKTRSNDVLDWYERHSNLPNQSRKYHTQIEVAIASIDQQPPPAFSKKHASYQPVKATGNPLTYYWNTLFRSEV